MMEVDGTAKQILGWCNRKRKVLDKKFWNDVRDRTCFIQEILDSVEEDMECFSDDEVRNN